MLRADEQSVVGVAHGQPSSKRAIYPAARASSPLRVVMVDEELPYPPTSGKRIRTLNLTLRLARRHRLTYVCHRNADEEEARKAAEFFRKHGIETLVVERTVPTKSGLGFYLRLAANLLSPLPYSVATHKAGHCAMPWSSLPATAVDVWHCEWTPYAETLRGIASGTPGRHRTQRRVDHLAALLRDGDQSAASLVHRPAVAQVPAALSSEFLAKSSAHRRRQRHRCSAAARGFGRPPAWTWWRTASIPHISNRKPGGEIPDVCSFWAVSIGGRTSTA